VKAIIPVAGIGTRLQPLTNKTPKVLVNVAGKPMLFHLIDEIIKNGKIDTIILIIGYLGGQIKTAVEQAYTNSKVKFEFVEQNQTLGLGHAVYHGKEFVGNEPVLIILGDTIFEFDWESVLGNEHSAIGVKDVDDVRRFGIVESDKGFVTRMIEKPLPEQTNSRAAIAGVYFVKDGQKLFKAVEHLMDNDIRTKNEYQLTDALMKMVSDGEKMTVFDIKWFDCGKPETLLIANNYLLNRYQDRATHLVYKNIKSYPPVFIGKDCIIENSEIGPNVTIADGAKDVKSKIKNSLILENAIVENAELDEVVLGAGEHIKGKHHNVMKAEDTTVSF
jgi:glucose-1-phosphate thymidylyltransferase